ncbi:MAG: hypothetical protein NTY74_15220 [Ignavibacteriae bacterium]|nr:hypothetical protein [Ignavibacteriota bacterium]
MVNGNQNSVFSKKPLQCAVILIFLSLISFSNSYSQFGRLYVNVPSEAHIFQLHYYNTHSNTWVDESIPVDENKSYTSLASLSYTKMMNYFGRSGGIGAVIPVSSLLSYNTGTDLITQRVGGLGDPSLMLDMNVYGGPSLTREQMTKTPPTTYMSAHFVWGVPLGSYNDTKSTNIGSNRFSYKFTLNQSFTTMKGKNWLDIYGSVKFSGDNKKYLGSNVLSQQPAYGLEIHYSQDVGNKWWLNAGGIYSGGGKISVNGVEGKEQNSFKLGLAASFPTWEHGSAIVSYNHSVWKTDGSPDVNQLIIQLNYTLYP